MTTICDIETVGLPALTILESLPPWDEQEARNRVPKNYKKEEAINGWLEEDKANHGKDAIEKAALNPETAKVVIFGTWRNGKVEQLILDKNLEITQSPTGHLNHHFMLEAELIEHAFMRLNEGAGALSVTDHAVLGWNLFWDLKMLIRRAWILGVPVPKSLYNPYSRYPIPERFIDLMEKYGVQRGEKFHSMNAVTKALRVTRKTGDGSEFGKLWETDRSKALEYNSNDLAATAEVAKKMGML